jgi:iduronate 2-sulfatase
MKYLCAAICASLLGPLSWAENVHLYFIGGQSNANGRANAADIPAGSPFASPQTDVGFYYHNPLDPGAGQTVLPELQMIDLAPGSGHGGTDPVYASEFGPEVSFGRTLADALPQQNILLVKHTEGGTNLHTEWAAGGRVYNDFLSTTSAAINQIIANGDTPVLMGMVWVQGESDSGSPFADDYGDNLADLISRVRTDVFGGELAPFVFSQLSDNQYDALNTGRLAVRSGQLTVSQTVANTALVVTDDDALFTTRTGDQIHFDANGQINLGIALGNEMIALVPEPTSLGLVALGGLLLTRRRRR